MKLRLIFANSLIFGVTDSASKDRKSSDIINKTFLGDLLVTLATSPAVIKIVTNIFENTAIVCTTCLLKEFGESCQTAELPSSENKKEN